MVAVPIALVTSYVLYDRCKCCIGDWGEKSAINSDHLDMNQSVQKVPPAVLVKFDE